MIFRKLLQWALLGGLVAAGSAFGAKLDFIPSKEIPVQTLTSSGGLKVLFSELHTTPLVSVYMGVKNIPTDSISCPNRALILLLQNILRDKASKKIEIERVRHPMKESTSMYCVQSLQSVTELNLRIISLPDQLEDTLSHLIESLHNISADDFQKAQDYTIRQANQLIEEDPYARLLGKWAFVSSIENNVFVSPTVDWADKLRRLRLKDLKTYVAHHFTQDNLVVSAAGDIQPDRLLKMIEASLGRLPQKSAQLTTQHKNLHKIPEKVKKTHIFKDIPHSIICFGHPLLLPTHPDYKFERLFAEFFNVTVASILFEELNEECNNAKFYYDSVAWSSMTPTQPKVGGTFLVMNNANVVKILASLKQSLRELKTEGLNSKRLYQLKQYITEAENKIKVIDDFPLFSITADALKSSPTSVAYYLFTQETNRLETQEKPRTHLLERERQACTDNWHFKSELLSELERNLEAVNRVIKKHIDPEKLSFLEVGLVNHLKEI